MSDFEESDEIPSWVNGRSTTSPNGIMRTRGSSFENPGLGHQVRPLHADAFHAVQIFRSRPAEIDGSRKRFFQENGIIEEEIAPQEYVPTADQAGWSLRAPSFGIWGFISAKSGVDSEDAEPLMVRSISGSTQTFLLGVFDGMGGAGSSVNEGSSNSYTEAYRASRIVRREVMMHCIPRLVDVDDYSRKTFDAADLAAAISTRLAEVARLLPRSTTTKIRGTLTKSYPTTIACAEVQTILTGPGRVRGRARVFWAGDSRVWVISPHRGLQQLTRDDVSIEDSLEQLWQDPPMSNVISASQKFVINEHEIVIDGPCLILVGTDGVSGYVRSPGEVELVVLQSIEEAIATGQPLEKVMWHRFRTISKDDVSAVVLAIGFEDLREIADLFRRRMNRVESNYRNLSDSSTSESEEILALWAIERDQYCALMPKGRR